MESSERVALTLVIFALSLAGCATLAEKNSAACEHKMRATAEPALVSVSANQTSPDGREVTVTGMIEDRQSHSLVPAKVECQFHGDSISVFRWVEPAALATRPDKAPVAPR